MVMRRTKAQLRYSACSDQNTAYLVDSQHPSVRLSFVAFEGSRKRPIPFEVCGQFRREANILKAPVMEVVDYWPGRTALAKHKDEQVWTVYVWLRCCYWQGEYRWSFGEIYFLIPLELLDWCWILVVEKGGPFVWYNAEFCTFGSLIWGRVLVIR